MWISLKLHAAKNPGLSFGIDKVVRVETPVADEFEQIREETGGEFDL